MRSKLSQFALAVALPAATLLAYLPAMRAGFIWDDGAYLYNNPEVTKPGRLARIWFDTKAEQYYPVAATSFWLEYRWWRTVGRGNLGADRPAGYHLTNVLLHGLAAVLVWRVLRRLNVPAAWLAGLLFALHPVSAASACWIAERKNMLSLILSLLAVTFYLGSSGIRDQGSGVEALSSRRPSIPDPRPSYFHYAVSLLLFGLALLSKTAVAALPAVLLLLTWWRRRRLCWGDLARVLPFMALAALAGVLTVWFERHGMAGDPPPPRDLATRLAGAGWAVWFYLAKALLPSDLTMVYRPWRVVPTSLATFMPPAVLVLAGAALWRRRTSWGRPLLLAVGCYVSLLLPALGLVSFGFLRYSPVADHWQYASLAAITAVAVAAGGWTWQRWPHARPIGLVVASVVVGGLGLLTWQRTGVYHDEVSLWSDNIVKNPVCWVGYNNRGNTWLNRGRADLAIADLTMAVTLKPDYAEAYNNRAGAYSARGGRGDGDLALADFNRAIKLKPDQADALNGRGNIFKALGQFEQAIADHTRAIESRPGFALAYSNRAAAYLDWGRPQQALADMDRALALNPDFAEAYGNRGLIHRALGRHRQAVADLSQAIRLKPAYAQGWCNRSTVWMDLEQYDHAIADATRAIELQPDYADAYNNRGNGYLKKEDCRAAIADYSRALELRPDYVLAYSNRGNAYQMLGMNDQALSDYNRGIALNPKMPVLYYNRAVAYRAMGDRNRAAGDPGRAKDDYGRAWADVRRCRSLGFSPPPDFIKDLTAASSRPE